MENVFGVGGGGIMVERFVATTRKRGEIDYYNAIWVKYPKARGGYAVKFIEGPHKGETYESIFVSKRGE